jgi:hypothetical protein
MTSMLAGVVDYVIGVDTHRDSIQPLSSMATPAASSGTSPSPRTRSAIGGSRRSRTPPPPARGCGRLKEPGATGPD